MKVRLYYQYMAQVTIYSSRPCPFCERAKAFLKSRDISFEEIDLTLDHQAKVELIERTHFMTVPQIFIGDEFIGGFQELVAYDQAGKLASLSESL